MRASSLRRRGEFRLIGVDHDPIAYEHARMYARGFVCNRVAAMAPQR